MLDNDYEDDFLVTLYNFCLPIEPCIVLHSDHISKHEQGYVYASFHF